MRSGGCPAGSGRALRLDPFCLPVRFAATDAAADERVRHVELHRERVVVRRSLAGMRMALNMPVSAFAGIGLKVVAGQGGNPASVSVMLEHKDPGLALPLFVSYEADDAMAEWRCWGAALGLPLLVQDDDLNWREPFARMGGIGIGKVRQRRRPGKLSAETPVHRGEREIIART